jgi:TonB family protein
MLSCPPTPAAIVQRAEVEMPEMARQMHAEGTTIVKLDIDASGKVTKVVVHKSSGNSSLDQAALKAGRETGFKPATESCKPVASVYLMVVDFHS